MTAIRLIGSYEVPIAEEERRWITANVTMSAEATQDELANLALIEIEVQDASEDFDLGLLHQRESEQAPWLERYFAQDGTKLIGDEKPSIPHFRVCFFLHQCQPAEPISSPYGTLIPGRRTALPERLKEACAYEHPG